MNIKQPQTLEEFIGQEEAKYQATLAIKNAMKQKIKKLPHILIVGPWGHGKTTLAYILAKEIKTEIFPTTGNHLEDPVKFLEYMRKGWDFYKKQKRPPFRAPVLFIDEVHALEPKIQELFYIPMLEGKIDINGKRMDAPPFTLIGATNTPTKLTKPFLSRFSLKIELQNYSEKDILEILKMQQVAPKVKRYLKDIAKRSRFNPRIALNHLFWSMEEKDPITYFTNLKIDEYGLNEMDRQYLKTLEKINRPCSTKMIATMMAVEETLIKDTEAYLLQIGFVQATLRGKQISEAGRNYLAEKQLHS